MECKEDKPELALQSQVPDNSDVLRLIHVPLESQRGDLRRLKQMWQPAFTFTSHQKAGDPFFNSPGSHPGGPEQKTRKEKGRPCLLPASSPHSSEVVCLPVLCAMDTFGSPVKSMNASQKKKFI